MFDYLQKFNNLPQTLRDSVSSPAAMAVISDLENKYKVDLAATVMKVMVKIIPVADLSIYFVSDFSLSQEMAKKLTADLKERLFFSVANYLGFNVSYSSILPRTMVAKIPDAVFLSAEKVVKESGITFPGLDLNYRLKNIITTYLKGIRSRVDARLTLNKEVIAGGLGLDHSAIDKIFKLCDELLAAQTLPSGAINSLPSGELVSLPLNSETPSSGLDKIRELYEKPGSARDIPYDLKSAIVNGEIKKPVAPFNLPIPEETKEKLLAAHNPEDKPIVISTPPAKIPEPIIVSEIKISIPTPVAPVIPLVPKIPVAPMVDSIKAASLSRPVTRPAEAFKLNQNANIPEAKIVRPPEKKPNIFSLIFGAKKTAVTKSVAEVSKLAMATSSMATLRTEAAAFKNNSIIKGVVHQPITPDIRLAPKVMGPLEELRYLDLVNFRRFGSSPEECTKKVESKIKLLEKDGYDKMVKGVTSWRENPINILYLKMGQEALNSNLSFKQYALNCQTPPNNNFLFWEEIEAITALNSRLMF